MVFITEGMHLRIPEGGLVLSLDGSEPPPLVIEVSLDMWRYWQSVALDQLTQCRSAATAADTAHTDGDDTRKGVHLAEEAVQGMCSIASSAFALDAFYAAVRERSPLPPVLTNAWKTSRSSRGARISEVLRRNFVFDNERAKRLRRMVQDVFRFRDLAVHPPASFSRPVLHPRFHVGVEWRFVAFQEANAHAVAKMSIEVLDYCTSNVRPKAPRALQDWAADSRARVEPLVERLRQIDTPGA